MEWEISYILTMGLLLLVFPFIGTTASDDFTGMDFDEVFTKNIRGGEK